MGKGVEYYSVEDGVYKAKEYSSYDGCVSPLLEICSTSFLWFVWRLLVRYFT